MDLLGKRKRGDKAIQELVKVSSRRWKKKYDFTYRYQMEWAAKAP